jgi:hypothetical protein
MTDQEEEKVYACPFMSAMVLETVLKPQNPLQIARSGNPGPQVAQVPRFIPAGCMIDGCEIWDSERKRCSMSTGSRLPLPPSDVAG